MKKILKDENGSVMLWTGAGLFVILAVTALVVDMGRAYIEKAKLQTGLDSASLAGVAHLPDDAESAMTACIDIADRNGIPMTTEEVQVLSTNMPNDTLILVKRISFSTVFAKLLGKDIINVSATSKAMVINRPLKNTKGSAPLGIEKPAGGWIYGVSYVLKRGGGAGYHGNYGALRLGGSGADVYYNNLKYGYQGIVSIGDVILTKPGNMSGYTRDGVNFRIRGHESCAFDNHEPDCPRLIKVIIVDTMQVDGTSPVTVVGFSYFFINGIVGSGGEAEIEGVFLQEEIEGKGISNQEADFGLMAKEVTLVK